MTEATNETRVAAGALLRGHTVACVHLAVNEGPDAGRRLPLGPDQTLGRGRSADLRLSDPAASRLHVRVTQVDGRIVLADLRSKNGVRVNGERCGAARPLAFGDEVAIGGTRLTLEPGLLDAMEARSNTAARSAPAPAGLHARRSPWTAPALLAGAGALVAAALLIALPW